MTALPCQILDIKVDDIRAEDFLHAQKQHENGLRHISKQCGEDSIK